VQPRASEYLTEPLRIGALKNVSVAVEGAIYGDNFEPQPVSLEVSVETKTATITRAQLVDFGKRIRSGFRKA
jgi:hypothetical protein